MNHIGQRYPIALVINQVEFLEKLRIAFFLLYPLAQGAAGNIRTGRFLNLAYGDRKMFALNIAGAL